MPGYQAFSFTRRTSAATAKLLLCRLTENVGVIPLFSCLEIRFCQLFARFVSRIPFLYYAVHFWLPFVRKIQTECEFSSLCVVVMFPPKTSVPCARVRNDRNWREKNRTFEVKKYYITLHCIVLHYIALYYIILYHIISYHIISYHIISYHIISYHIISYHIISYHIISYHIISYRIVSYRIVSYHIISYYIILYYIVLYCIILYYIILYYIIV